MYLRFESLCALLYVRRQQIFIILRRKMKHWIHIEKAVVSTSQRNNQEIGKTCFLNADMYTAFHHISPQIPS